MAYRNFNTQIRQTADQDLYWTVRPYGNPFPASCHGVAGFYYETITWSADKLTHTVETVWEDRDAFLAVMPPDVFEQPQFQEWHDENNIIFKVEEDHNFEHDPERVGKNLVIQL